MVQMFLLDSATTPDGAGELRLYQHSGGFSIQVDGIELMNSFMHASEDALGRLPCRRLSDTSKAIVLIGGLGMGYTLAAALHQLGPQAKVVVAELVAAVISWNHGPLGPLAGHPLNDKRTSIYHGDVADCLRVHSAFDAIILDVDNGPEARTQQSNNWLYSLEGLKTIRTALRPNGMVSIWSRGAKSEFEKRLRSLNFTIETANIPACSNLAGPRHTVWLARVASERPLRPT